MATFGISKIGGTLVESVDLTCTAEVKELITSDGLHSEARSVDRSFSFSVKGKGTLPSITLGGASGEPDGATGKVIVTKITESQTNEDFEGWSYEGVSYPSA
jgi:hypothetical protein